MVSRLLVEVWVNLPREIRALCKLLGVAAQEGPYREFFNANSAGLSNFDNRKARRESGYSDRCIAIKAVNLRA